MIPRCYLSGLDPPNSVRLVGFCDASAKAYAAVVYLRLEGESHMSVRFLAAKTRVSPLGGMTIPRLELLSALLLSKLMTSTREALQSQLSFSDPVCYTDSKVAALLDQGLQPGMEAICGESGHQHSGFSSSPTLETLSWQRKSSGHTLQRHDCFRALGK